MTTFKAWTYIALAEGGGLGSLENENNVTLPHLVEKVSLKQKVQLLFSVNLQFNLVTQFNCFWANKEVRDNLFHGINFMALQRLQINKVLHSLYF